MEIAITEEMAITTIIGTIPETLITRHFLDRDNGRIIIQTTGNTMVSGGSYSLNEWFVKFKEAISTEKFVEIKLRYG